MESLKIFTAWEDLPSDVNAGISARHGGKSSAPYFSLNCGLHVGDSLPAVLDNRKLIASTVGFPLESWVFGQQVHGCQVEVVTLSDRGKGTVANDTALHNVDGLVTNEPGVCLGAFYADCVPLYFYDPVQRVVGLAHAGWKGTAGRIAEATILKMQQCFECVPERILAAVGPSIGICCYEVDEKVIGQIKAADGSNITDGNVFGDDKPLFYPSANGKYQLSLQQLNRFIMLEAGIMASHIEISSWCTSCHTELFFSHRQEHGLTGRMMAWIGLS